MHEAGSAVLFSPQPQLRPIYTTETKFKMMADDSFFNFRYEGWLLIKYFGILVFFVGITKITKPKMNETSCGGTSKETIRKSTLTMVSVHGIMQNKPAIMQTYIWYIYSILECIRC